MNAENKTTDYELQSGTNADRLMTVEETARYLRLSTGTIRNYVSEGRMPFIRISRRAVRFRKASIDNWLSKREQTAHTRRTARPSRS